MRDVSQLIERMDLALPAENLPSNERLQKYDRLEEQALDTPSNRQEYLNLAFDFLRMHYMQDAIWSLQRADQDALVEELQKKIIAYVKAAKPAVSCASRNTLFLDFAGGIRGVFKTENNLDHPESEVWVYRLSEALGLNIVPLTFKYELNGAIGSLQLFVPDAPTGGVDYRNRAQYPQNLAALFALDYLTFNTDRNYLNWLRRGNRAVAIDNSLTYNGRIAYDEPQPLTNTPAIILEGTRTLRLLSAQTDDQIRDRLKEAVPSNIVDFYLKRRSELMRRLIVEQQSCQNLLRKAG